MILAEKVIDILANPYDMIKKFDSLNDRLVEDKVEDTEKVKQIMYEIVSTEIALIERAYSEVLDYITFSDEVNINDVLLSLRVIADYSRDKLSKFFFSYLALLMDVDKDKRFSFFPDAFDHKFKNEIDFRDIDFCDLFGAVNG